MQLPTTTTSSRRTPIGQNVEVNVTAHRELFAKNDTQLKLAQISSFGDEEEGKWVDTDLLL